MVSDDRDFETKATDILGLHLDPPNTRSGVLRGPKERDSGAEPAGPRAAPSPGRAERHWFEYYRHGTFSLRRVQYDLGQIVGKAVARHTGAEFVAFLTNLVADQPARKEIHIICNNLSAHKTRAIRDFLADHPKVRFRGQLQAQAHALHSPIQQSP